jgi:hypothetical protein
MAAARDAGVAVWLIVDVGRRLPAPLFDALVARATAAPRSTAASRSTRPAPSAGAAWPLAIEVVPVAEAERVVEPRRVDCPVPPELLRSPGGW